MVTATRITNVFIDALVAESGAEVRVTQYAIEVVYAYSAGGQVTQIGQEIIYTERDVDAEVAGFGIEVLLQSPRATVVLSGATVMFLVSGVSYVNAIGRAPLTVEAQWDIQAGYLSPLVFSAFQMSGAENEAGFVSILVASVANRTYNNAGGLAEGQRPASASVSGPVSTVSAQYAIYVKAEQIPSPYEGPYQGESQPRRRVWP